MHEESIEEIILQTHKTIFFFKKKKWLNSTRLWIYWFDFDYQIRVKMILQLKTMYCCYKMNKKLKPSWLLYNTRESWIENLQVVSWWCCRWRVAHSLQKQTGHRAVRANAIWSGQSLAVGRSKLGVLYRIIITWLIMSLEGKKWAGVLEIPGTISGPSPSLTPWRMHNGGTSE